MNGYLVDAIQEMSRVSIPRIMRPLEPGSLLWSVSQSAEMARQIEGRELYTFDVSALNAASDLRIDTPERLERLVDAVLRSPRRLYLEADLTEVGVIGEHIRGVLEPERAKSIDQGWRWAAVVDVLGDGRAEFCNLLWLPGQRLKRMPAMDGFQAEMREWPSALRKWTLPALRIMREPSRYSIDLSRKVGMSKAEFVQALERIRGGNDQIVLHASAALAAASGVRARGQVIDAAWQALRFRDLVRREADPVGPMDRLQKAQQHVAAQAVGFEGVSFGLPVIALLALLQASSEDIRVKPRSSGTKGRERSRAQGKAVQPSSQAAGLRIVTLNLEDRGLQSLYDGSGAVSSAPGVSSEPGSGRVRHPVRGHLFLARNGQLTWRRPHWRGSIEAPTLRRVVAPSHGGDH